MNDFQEVYDMVKIKGYYPFCLDLLEGSTE